MLRENPRGKVRTAPTVVGGLQKKRQSRKLLRCILAQFFKAQYQIHWCPSLRQERVAYARSTM